MQKPLPRLPIINTKSGMEQPHKKAPESRMAVIKPMARYTERTKNGNDESRAIYREWMRDEH
jgi:hypothetical protein